MAQQLHGVRGGRGRWLAGLGGLTLAAFSFTGCASFWDDVTSHDFQFSSLFSKPNPLVVLEKSHDGDARARAFRSLREPLQNGGTQADQDMVIKLLTAGATVEPQPLCRLAAIESLGHFKDPQAVKALKEAYLDSGVYPPDTRTLIQCQALKSLGETRNTEAIGFLARTVNEPAVQETQATVDRRQSLDVRLAAARALGNYNQREATDALLHVLQKEKDIALRDRAQESLQLATGKTDVPPDGQAWSDYFSRQGDRATAANDQPSLFQRLTFWQTKEK